MTKKMLLPTPGMWYLLSRHDGTKVVSRDGEKQSPSASQAVEPCHSERCSNYPGVRESQASRFSYPIIVPSSLHYSVHPRSTVIMIGHLISRLLWEHKDG